MWKTTGGLQDNAGRKFLEAANDAKKIRRLPRQGLLMVAYSCVRIAQSQNQDQNPQAKLWKT